MSKPQAMKQTTTTRRLLFIGVASNKQLEIQSQLSPFHFEYTFCDTPSKAIDVLQQLPSPLFEAFVIDEDTLNRADFKTFYNYRKQPLFNVIPMILQVNNANAAITQQALENGIYFSLSYPYEQSLFNSVFMAATHGFSQHLEVSHRLTNFDQVHPLLQKVDFKVKTIQDAQTVSSVLAFITPDQKRVAIGLFELILNAIEHGNLGIGYQDKTRLTSSGSLQAEIDRRLNLPENRNKFVDVGVKRFKKHLEFTIKDCGKGFDYSSYLAFVKNRALDHHGRGIMIANQLSFDSLEYQDAGSKVVCTVNI